MEGRTRKPVSYTDAPTTMITEGPKSVPQLLCNRSFLCFFFRNYDTVEISLKYITIGNSIMNFCNSQIVKLSFPYNFIDYFLYNEVH